MTNTWQEAVDEIAGRSADDLQVILVPAEQADDVGSVALQAAANKAGTPVAVSPGDTMLENRIYWPKAIR